jgi:hypothetical protein
MREPVRRAFGPYGLGVPLLAGAWLLLPDGASQGFTDLTHLDPAAQLAINQLAQLGVTAGTGPGTYSPQGIVTRWQMALFITRILASEQVALPEGSDQGFTDLDGLPIEQQTAINQLARLGITAGIAPGTFDPQGLVTRQQMASFLIRTVDVVRGGSA